MKQTALYEIHKKNGAKIVGFAGWQMPIMYSGIREEHKCVRDSLGVFDVSHMGEILVKGKEAKHYCQYVTTNDLELVKENQAQYTLICNHEGGVVDDVIVYKFSDTDFLFCVNASNTNKDFEWLKSNSNSFEVQISDASRTYSQLAIQGPNSKKALIKIFGELIDSIKRFHFADIDWNGVNAMIARTGYTGEEGFEIFLPWEKGPLLWSSIMNSGEEFNIVPCGLGARDILRLEMGYSLYGNELGEDISPLEAGLGRYVKLDKDEFIGKKPIEDLKKNGLKRELVGFEMNDKGIARHNYKILKNDVHIGYVTSGTLSPSLEKSIGLGLINSEHPVDNEFEVEIRGDKRLAKVVSIPFYNKK